MPYTLVHSVAAVPVWAATGHRLRLAALAIGALTPDYQYFLAMNTVGGYMHSPAGLVLACIPAGWLTLLLWDHLGRAGLAAFLPAPWRPGLPQSPSGYNVPFVSLAILLGALTHVVWDSFTHGSGFVVTRIPFLSQVVQIGPITYPVFKFLQHGSTLAGAATLALLGLRWARRQPPVTLAAVAGRVLLAGLFLGTFALLNAMRFRSHGIERILVTSGVAVTLGVGVGPILLGLFAPKIENTVG